MPLSAILRSTLTCPTCGARSEETMPSDACLYFHECPSCGTLLRPLPGHCCVFCSFGSVPCPPVRLASPCCAADPDEPPRSQ